MTNQEDIMTVEKENEVDIVAPADQDTVLVESAKEVIALPSDEDALEKADEVAIVTANVEDAAEKEKTVIIITPNEQGSVTLEEKENEVSIIASGDQDPVEKEKEVAGVERESEITVEKEKVVSILAPGEEESPVVEKSVTIMAPQEGTVVEKEKVVTIVAPCTSSEKEVTIASLLEKDNQKDDSTAFTAQSSSVSRNSDNYGAPHLWKSKMLCHEDVSSRDFAVDLEHKVQFALDETGHPKATTYTYENLMDETMWWNDDELDECVESATETAKELRSDDEYVDALVTLFDEDQEATEEEICDSLEVMTEYGYARGLEMHVMKGIKKASDEQRDRILLLQKKLRKDSKRDCQQIAELIRKKTAKGSRSYRYFACRLAEYDAHSALMVNITPCKK